ncbi:hypothetical protein FQR65_LT03628 [Abscondita terminalis]|nr:hypothetical protein FQR65_LT03628 [Abscondita terminalis]
MSKENPESLHLIVYFLECILQSIKEFSAEDFPVIIEALQDAFSKLSMCSDLYLTGTSSERFTDWVNCVINKIQLITAADIPHIIKRLKPIIQRFQNVEYCYRQASDFYCANYCSATVLGIPVVCVPSTTDLFTLLGYLLYGLSQFYCVAANLSG